MSLKDGSFNLAAQDFYGSASARVETSPDDLYETDGVTMDSGPDLMDTFFDRSRAQAPLAVAPSFNSFSNPGSDRNADPAMNGQTQNANLQAAWSTARNFQRETAKLESGKITAASGPGARNTGNYIEGKAAATQDLQANLAALRKDNDAGQQGGPQQAQQVDAGGGAVSFTGKMAGSAVLGAIADIVFPGAGTAMTVAAAGAGTFGAKSPRSEFSSAADSVYQPQAGHETFDIMQPGTGTPALSGAAIDRKLSTGPGFSMGEIEHIVEPSLNETRVTFAPEQIDALQATVSQMQRDVDLGANMYRNWMESDVTVTDKIGSTPMTDLKVDDEDMAALTRDNPALDNEAMKPPTVSAMKLV